MIFLWLGRVEIKMDINLSMPWKAFLDYIKSFKKLDYFDQINHITKLIVLIFSNLIKIFSSTSLDEPTIQMSGGPASNKEDWLTR